MAFESFLLWLKSVKPYLAMVSLQVGYAGMFIITRVSLDNGMSPFVLSVYRHAIATAVIAPFALALERKTRPKMTASIFLNIMALGILEPVAGQDLYNLGMKYTSASFASATINTLPAVTFLLAILFRLEVVNIKKMSSLAKVIGTAVTVAGSLLMTLYKGPVVNFIMSPGIAHAHGASTTTGSTSQQQQWILGTLALLISAFGWACFFILQSFALKEYPAPLTLTALICVAGALEGAAVTPIFERDMSVWLLGWDSRLLAVVYSGVVCSAIAYYVQGMVIRERGPVFVTAFSPLCMVFTAAMGIIILAETLYLGSIVGAIVTGIGLYIVVWGMSKEYTKSSSVMQLGDDQEVSSAHKLPITVIKLLEADHQSMADDRFDSHKTRGTSHKGYRGNYLLPRSSTGPTTTDITGMRRPLISLAEANNVWRGGYYVPDPELHTFSPYVGSQAAKERHIYSDPSEVEVDDGLSEDEVDEEGRPLPRDTLGRVFLIPSGINSFMDYKAGANRISSVLMRHVDRFYPHRDGGPIYSWVRIPKRGQDMMVKEWKKRVFWNPKHEEYFTQAFHFWAQKLLGDMLRQARRDNAKPHWINDDHWAKMLDIWEWKRISNHNMINAVNVHEDHASRQTDSPRSQQDDVPLMRKESRGKTKSKSMKGSLNGVGMNRVLSKPPSSAGSRSSRGKVVEMRPERDNEEVENEISNLKAMQAKQQQDIQDMLSAQRTLIDMLQGIQHGHYSLQQQQQQSSVSHQTSGTYGRRIRGASRMQTPWNEDASAADSDDDLHQAHCAYNNN